jgi:hypothetical protein
MIQRMASEIGLDLSRRYDNSDPDSGKADMFRWNDLRTRAFMIINDHRQVKCTSPSALMFAVLTCVSRFCTFSGRVPMDLSHFELDDAELDEVTCLGRHQSAASLAAFYHLYLFDVRNSSVLLDPTTYD